MDYKSALALKNTISDEIIHPFRKKIARVFSAGSFGLRSIRLSRDLLTSVNGVGISENAGGGFQLKILTRSSLFSVQSLAAYYNLSPAQVSVRKAGPIRLLAYTERYRPPFPGASVGHAQVSAGTLGCFVRKPEDDAQYLLGNNHILANHNNCSIGDPVYQPGMIDGAMARDVIARLADYEPLSRISPNYFDAAIARMEVSSAQTSIYGIGQVTGMASPLMDTRVLKTGRSTGLTRGAIVSTSTDIEVDFGHQRKLVFLDQFEIEGRTPEDVPTGFSSGGDSGALVVAAESNKAVGLLFAGDDTGSSYASPVEPILTRFGVYLV